MSRTERLAIAGILLVVAAGAACGKSEQPAKTASAAPAATATPKVLYWYDPMKPEVHFDHPGKSPFMVHEIFAEQGTLDKFIGDGIMGGIQGSRRPLSAPPRAFNGSLTKRGSVKTAATSEYRVTSHAVCRPGRSTRTTGDSARSLE